MRFVWIGLVTVAVFLGGLLYWSMATRISGAIIASGRTEVDSNRHIIQHLEGGVVAEIRVSEGSKVAKGDLLIRLDGAALRSDLALVENQLFEVLARMGRLQAERDDTAEITFDPLLLAQTTEDARALMRGQERLFHARVESGKQQTDQLLRRREQITQRITGIHAQSESLGTQLALIEEELSNQTSLLDKGLAQASRVLALRREQAVLTGQTGELSATLAQADEQITEINIEILRLSSERREDAIQELRDSEFRKLDLLEKRQAIRRKLDNLDMRATTDGVVYGLSVFAAEAVLRPAEPVMYLVPQNRPLVITARVAATDVDQVFVGQAATLHFASFDQRTTPQLFGTVGNVSADAFTDDRTGMSFYRIELLLNDGEMARIQDTILPGMPVEAFISTTDRSPMAYLTKPLADYFNKAMREN